MSVFYCMYTLVFTCTTHCSVHQIHTIAYIYEYTYKIHITLYNCVYPYMIYITLYTYMSVNLSDTNTCEYPSDAHCCVTLCAYTYQTHIAIYPNVLALYLSAPHSRWIVFKCFYIFLKYSTY